MVGKILLVHSNIDSRILIVYNLNMSNASLNKTAEDHADLDKTVEEERDPFYDLHADDMGLVMNGMEQPLDQEASAGAGTSTPIQVPSENAAKKLSREE